MPGGQVVGAQRERVLEQGAELDVLVAGEAGVRRPPRRVLGHEPIHDALGELALHVEHVVADAERGGGGAGVVHVFDGTAALVVARGRGVLDRPEAHGDADDVVALLEEQGGGDGGVDPSGHSDNNPGHGTYHVILNGSGVANRGG